MHLRAVPRLRRPALLAACLALVSGCALLGVRQQRAEFESFARIRGEARLDVPNESPIVVVLAKPSNDPNALPSEVDDHTGFIVDHFLLERAGSFAFAVSPGTFRLSAFADRNANLVYDPGEPALVGQPVFDVGPGQQLDDLDLVIPHDASLDRRYDIPALQARTPLDQHNFSLGRFTAWGEVVDLDDPKLGRASGEMGMWRFADFLFEVGPGIYFLEEYDPRKVPVLFLHGMGGYPQEFAPLIARMDRERFQPWLYFYPSGIHLDGIARHLTEVVMELQERHGVDELAVVAHSMGGLVARAFLLQYAERPGACEVPVFVAISSPWGGSEDAANVGRMPHEYVVYSWLDMKPRSDFLRGLFREPPDFERERSLPGETAFHVIFGYRRDEGSRGASSDGVVTVRSEARLEAIRSARSILPLDEGHVDILANDETAKRLGAILRDAFDEPFWKGLGAR